MSVWTALIIIQGTFAQPMPLVNSTGDQPPDKPLSVEVGQYDKPNIDLNVHSFPDQHISKMTGVEADTYINVPTAITVVFPSKELCEAALLPLQKQGGVYSISCFQSQ